MRVKPGYAHLLAIKFLHHDKFLAPRQFVPRHCASAHLPAPCNRDNLPATYQPCNATRVMLSQFRTWTAKTRATPPLAGTLTPFIAGPLGAIIALSRPDIG
jgi:hypothetical protein